MVAIGRALMSGPRLLLLDEPSLGLAPTVVDRVFEVIEALHREGTAVLLVEQNVARALAVASRAYVLAEGRSSPTARRPRSSRSRTSAAPISGTSGPERRPGPLARCDFRR